METNNLIQFLELQLTEVEMLSSMYPNKSEFNVTLPSVVADMNNYIAEKTKRLPNHLDYTINLEIPDVKDKLEININLPHSYPFVEPNVSARSAGLNRAQQTKLNSSIVDFLTSQEKGELCVVSLVTWLSENAATFFTVPTSLEEPETLQQNDIKDSFCRLWFYSHHIYNKFKRRQIVDTGQSMTLTGFSLPGKPGFICVEGTKKDCNSFHLHLKQMTWKKMSLVKEEIEDNEFVSVDNLRKFDSFQEISFQVRQGPSKEYHMDMGQFFKYLEAHNCAYAFHDLFGFDGHGTDVK